VANALAGRARGVVAKAELGGVGVVISRASVVDIGAGPGSAGEAREKVDVDEDVGAGTAGG
jgi:hypothetical protein